MKFVVLVLLGSFWLEVVSIHSVSSAHKLVSATEAIPDSTLSCPADVRTLTDLLLQDLPDYANRVIQRAAILPEAAEIDVYVLTAGRPEFEPLSLGPGVYEDTLTDPKPPLQVFFTTLERQYLDEGVVTVQNYHWLFLTETSSGWRMALLYTRLGSPSATSPPRPPLETSEGIIGQAVSLWLRDCRAGKIRTR